MGEVFTLYFSQRIASTELDRTREPIPVRLLTHRRPWEGPFAGGGDLVRTVLYGDMAGELREANHLGDLKKLLAGQIRVEKSKRSDVSHFRP